MAKITVDNSPAAEGNLGFWANQVTSELGNDVTNFSDAKVKSVLPHDAYVQAQNGTGIGGVGSISDPNYSRLLTANNPALASAFARLSAAIGSKTSEGLNVRKVSTVAIDPMTGNPVGQQSLQTALNAKAAQMAAAKAVPGGVINPAGTKVVNNKVVGGDQSRLAPSTALAFGNGAAVPPPVAAITNALRPAARAALVAKPKGASTVTLAQINQRAPVNITVPGTAPQVNALRAPNPTVDVTGMSQQHNAGGWGINQGGGIVAF